MRALTSSVRSLTLAQHHVFLQRLHCVYVLVIFFLNQVDLTERASSNDFDDLEIFYTDLLGAVIWISSLDSLVRVSDSSSVIAIHFCGDCRSLCDSFHLGVATFSTVQGEVIIDLHWAFAEAILTSLSHFDY